MRQNVTVDLGLRWEYYNPLVGRRGQGHAVELRPGDQHAARRRATAARRTPLNVKNYFKNFGPRTGVSWRLERKDRAARRLRREHDSLPGQPLRVQLPGEAELLGRGGRTASSAPGSMATGFPAAGRSRTFPPTASSRSSGSLLNSTYDVISARLHEGTLHSWNVAFQRQLPYGFTADIAYVGSKGVDLVMDLDTNASLIYGSGNVGRPQFAQFNRTGTSRTRTNLGKSRYNGLQVKVDRRFMNGFLITNSYTLGRSMDLANENTGIGTPIDFDLSWARSDTDRLHNYVLVERLRAAVGSEQAVDERQHARQDRRRLAAERPVRRAVGPGADHRRQRHAAQHAGQHRVRQPERRQQGARRARSRASCTSTRRSTRCRRPACRAT